ncbi:hypothetical protein A6035_01020 [Dietzia lutea]|uniref:FAD-dependent oxidoreductase 2 FAD-binding domain-containing protein n=2 Tax=Dietzia lutea TaxID=546160 RepID=A0A2S1R3X4_9ACTN|nr:hypothetical protein A6035_01020 [Dietzia lutea]
MTAAFTAAANGAEVLLVEESDMVGGTTAWSGGHVWIPCNPHQKAIGVVDPPEQGLRYIMSLSRGLIDENLIRSYIANGSEAVSYLDEQAGTVFYAVRDFADYHPGHPGGLPGGGRTIECSPFSFLELGP